MLIINLKQINLGKMTHSTVLRIEEIDNFKERLQETMKVNGNVNGVIRDVGHGKFENVDDRLQNLIIDEILKLKAKN